MKVGYARTSTVEQRAGFEAQIEVLTTIGCDKIFQEQVSSVVKRDQLDAALDFIREGDTLVVTKLDRLARSVFDLLKIKATLDAMGAHLKVLEPDLDTSTAHGQFQFTIIGAVAEFERALMLERQREGIAKAKAEGKYRGRAPTARAKAAEIMALRSQGISPNKIASDLGVGRSSVFRILAEQRAT
jgi:DNA invertase Pin-like site-specific DNA recombinase